MTTTTKYKLVFSLVLFCFCNSGFSQLPAYEYVTFKSTDRSTTVVLPEFSVQLKQNLKPEKTSFKEPSRLFVVSDIEGEYQQFKALLLAAGVMDKSFNWTFGTGHLAVIGDVFDRGSEVTECLWLIYHLEEKAKETGGYVHFILGNHELMNFNGDLRYNNTKYLKLAQQKRTTYNTFYNNETELGRWLETKNIAEKIGKLLLVHGGISPYVNLWGKSLDVLNEAARGNYRRYNDSLPTLETELLLFEEGPLWYRGYYKSPFASRAQIDSTLQLFDVEKIVTGHSPVDHVSSFYNGSIINVDVPHARGTSEGLLVEGRKYFRLDVRGKSELAAHKN